MFRLCGQEEESPEYSAVFHLFEHRYDARTVFWYGVLDVACSWKEFARWLYARPAENLRVAVSFAGGGGGECAHFNSSFTEGLDEQSHSMLAVVGLTALRR